MLSKHAPKTLTPEQRSQRARIAALERWSRDDGKANGEACQAGLRRKFYNETDPTLPEAERIRRADCAYRAHMTRLAYLSPRARMARKAGEAA